MKKRTKITKSQAVGKLVVGDQPAASAPMAPTPGSGRRYEAPTEAGWWRRDGMTDVVKVERLRSSFLIVFRLGNGWNDYALPPGLRGGWYPVFSPTTPPQVSEFTVRMWEEEAARPPFILNTQGEVPPPTTPLH